MLQEQGDYGEADSLMHRSLAVYRGLPQESDALAVNLNSLGNLARYQGDLPAAEGFYREALAVHRRVLGDIHPFVATDLHNLGRLLDAMGQSERGREAAARGDRDPRAGLRRPPSRTRRSCCGRSRR